MGAFINNLIHFFIPFRRRQSPTPESMLFAVKERGEGIKHNTGFGGGGGLQGEGIGLFTVQKGTIIKKCVNTFVPHCGLRRFQRLDAIQTESLFLFLD